MSEEMLVYHCSPTLAGLKTANMFSMKYDNKNDVIKDLNNFNKMMITKGIKALPLRFSDKRVLVYIYRPIKLQKDLENKKARRILKNNGYRVASSDECIAQLMIKLNKYKEFPHEIGLFLGYPPEDVQGFIDNNASNYKCTGIWKVYGDEQKAKKLFAKYKKCTDVYYEQWLNGKSIERLTVAV